MVTTEASFTPNFQSGTSSRTQPSASPPPTVVPPTSSWPPQEWTVSPFVAAVPPSVNGFRERSVQEQSGVLHSQRKVATSNSYEREGHDRRAVSPPREQQAHSYLRREHSRSPPPPPPVRQQAKPEKTKMEERAPPQSRSIHPRGETPPTMVRSSQSEEDHPPPPPPVPAYNPAGPEEFLLSNKPEYKQEWKKMTNTYESVGERGASPPPPRVPVRQHHSRSETPPSEEPSSKSTAPSKNKYKDISTANVPLRSKKKGANQIATSAATIQEPVGHVEHHQSEGKKMKYNVSAAAASLPVAVKDVSDVMTACAGLPNNGKAHM